jgi:pilus assembly protein Flp/PilA
LRWIAFKLQEEGTMEWLKEFWMDEEGAAMPEYGLLVAFIAIVALVGVTVLGTNLLGRFNEVATAVGP